MAGVGAPVVSAFGLIPVTPAVLRTAWETPGTKYSTDFALVNGPANRDNFSAR